MTKHFGYIKGIEIVIGKKYFLNDELVILTNVVQSENCLEGFKTMFVFENEDGFVSKIKAKDLYKCVFKEGHNEPKNSGFINNDMVDSWRYSLLNQFGLGLNDYSFFDRTKEKIIEALAEKHNEEHRLPRKVIFNDKKKATTLLYGDEATVVKTCKGDKYDREKGFLMAFFQKQTGLSKTQAKKYLKEITKEKGD